MRFWHDFLDSLDSNGGHIAVLVFLMLLGAIAFRNGFPKAEDVVMGAFGALLLALKESGSNKERRDDVVSTATVETKIDKGDQSLPPLTATVIKTP